jgi:hypothetical protein
MFVYAAIEKHNLRCLYSVNIYFVSNGWVIQIYSLEVKQHYLFLESSTANRMCLWRAEWRSLTISVRAIERSSSGITGRIPNS